MSKIASTDLILNPDGSVYHLNLLPEDIADTIITVGDQDRVAEVSFFFDTIEIKKSKREFVTHTGYIGRKRISVISTGIGTDNIDIVLNELDALVNIDLETREPKAEKKSLTIVRIGTSGALQSSVPVDSVLVSEYAVGLDSLMHYYEMEDSEEELGLKQAFSEHLSSLPGISPYVCRASKRLLVEFGTGVSKGITVTTPGFYAPQGRLVRAKNRVNDLIQHLSDFEHQGATITNLEMETAGLYALAKVLGHEALSVNAILANRITNEFSKNPQQTISRAIGLTLKKLV
ncbi:nucleoside phosphorylase [Pedobacter sp. SYSU D00535]|uniref:nucleoside phosphorylase n=1 Tax=Pedobacter sp. SYSU D00535 TaxID=2810308 RepID=UPI001A96CE10|nr:nucleoside phosphorylase [Pedobacter sp. SYSU D00535]